MCKARAALRWRRAKAGAQRLGFLFAGRSPESLRSMAAGTENRDRAKGNADDHDHGSSNSVMQQQPIRTRTRTLKGVAINTGTESAQSSISSQCVDMLRDGCGVPKQRQL